jgi:hypothetical protein
VHRSKSAIEASLKVVNVVGILDRKHGSTNVMVNGRKEKRCSIVPGMTCDEHFAIADYAFLNGYDSVDGQVFVNVWSNREEALETRRESRGRGIRTDRR